MGRRQFSGGVNTFYTPVQLIVDNNFAQNNIAVQAKERFVTL